MQSDRIEVMAVTSNSMLTSKSSSAYTKETVYSLEDSIGHDSGGETNQIDIDAMGFGAIYTFRCSELNVLLCHMMCNNFDVENSKIKIRRRHLTITFEDFWHVMSIRDGGADIDLTGSLAEPDII